jgi:hypothetical protein
MLKWEELKTNDKQSASAYQGAKVPGGILVALTGIGIGLTFIPGVDIVNGHIRSPLSLKEKILL